MTSVHTVLGAGGAVGEQLVGALADAGLRVRAVTRRPEALGPQAESVTADVGTGDGARRAVQGSHVVYVCVQPAYTRWVEEFPPLVATIADAAADAGARLVLLDNLYGYGPSAAPMSEQTPQKATSRKGRVRAHIARDLLARCARGELAVTIARASDFVGPRGTSLPNVLVVEPVADGKRAGGSGGSTSRTASASPPTSPGSWPYWESPTRPSAASGTCPCRAHRLAGTSSSWPTASAGSTPARGW
jgi:nucleoside-diphosphate-sugar epimerase